jgi:ABC-type multidrug transport system fused ATPase/permease subunit
MSFGVLFPLLVGTMVDVAAGVAPAWLGRRGLKSVALLLVGTLLVQSALSFFSSYVYHKVGEVGVGRLRKDVFTHLMALPMRFFNEHRVGELASRLSSDLMQIQDLLSFTVGQAIRQCMLLVGGMAAIFITSWKLSLVMACSFPVLVAAAAMFGRSVRRMSREANDRLAATGVIAVESLQAIAAVKSFGNECYESNRFSKSVDYYIEAVLKSAVRRAALISFIIAGVFGSIVLVLWYGAELLQSGGLTHGELTRFLLYTTFIGGSVASAAEVVGTVNKSLGAASRVMALKNEVAEVITVDMNAPRLTGWVTFQDLTFAYPSRPEVRVLDGINLEARPGERIALVGPSGAGKSTVVSLLLRFYEPTSGELMLDGVCAADLSLGLVRSNVALVPQDVVLFGGSIRENIAYGRTGSSEAEIVRAAQLSCCEEFILRFPEGYDTLVGERGVQLSGGQRQRVAIARAFLRDPAILVLDEATSALDSESERHVQQALETLLKGRTSFVIAHRLSTVRAADRIYVLENGRVSESGRHEELIAKLGGTYRKLCELQFTR